MLGGRAGAWTGGGRVTGVEHGACGGQLDVPFLWGQLRPSWGQAQSGAVVGGSWTVGRASCCVLPKLCSPEALTRMRARRRGHWRRTRARTGAEHGCGQRPRAGPGVGGSAWAELRGCPQCTSRFLLEDFMSSFEALSDLVAGLTLS